MRRCVSILFVAAVLLLLPSGLFAQGDLGALTGSVMDPSGAVVPEATITITNIDTGAKWTVKSSSAGYYSVPVPPGRYRLEVQKEGFSTAITDNVVVPVAQVVTVDSKLVVGGATQTVTVSETAPLLTSATSEVGTTMSPQEFATLPIAVNDGGRDLQGFIFSSLPGSIGDGFQGSINGGQLFSHEILIDGISIARYDLSGGSLTEMTPAFDSASELKVQQSNYSAAYGETGGGIANISMKSGTNVLHGTLYEYLNNTVLDAAGWNVNALPQGDPAKQKPPYHDNNFGFGVGGPVVIPHLYDGRNRTFFYGNYEGDRFLQHTQTGLLSMPTVPMLGGDFSSLLGAQKGTDALGRPILFNEIYDPTTTRNVTQGQLDPVSGLVAQSSGLVRDPFMFNGQLNVIPPGEFSTATAKLLPLFPHPFSDAAVNNYPKFSTNPVLNVDTYSVKVDHQISEKNKISSFYNYNHRPRINRRANYFPPLPGYPLNPLKQQIVDGNIGRFSDDYTINDHTLNHAAVGFNRFSNHNNVVPPIFLPSQLGITGVQDLNFPPLNFLARKGLPFIKNHSGSTSGELGAGGASYTASESYILTDTLSYLRGKHDFRFGGEFRRYHYNNEQYFSESGTFNFSALQTSYPGFSTKTGHSFASFILGAVSGGHDSLFPTQPGYRQNLWAFYAQDDFKATSKLTINYGIRWEIPTPRTEAFSRMSGLDPTLANAGADNLPGALIFIGNCQGCNGRKSLQDRYWKEFGPRIGFAYSITPSMVFRGGYGISFSPPIENNFGPQNIFGFNADPAVDLSALTPQTPGGNKDPKIYWTPLTSAALPANAIVGVPPFSGTLPQISPTFQNGNAIDFLSPHSLAQPYVQNWSAGFQFLLPHDIMLETNYVGSKGTRLLDSAFGLLVNQASDKYLGLGDLLADDLASDLADPVNGPILASYGITNLPFSNFENLPNTSVGQAIMRFPQYTSVTDNWPAWGNSTYHSLQVTARKRTAHGLDFIAAYTYSKTLTNADSALYGYGGYVQNLFDRKAEKSVASFNFPHVLKLTWIYDLPFGHGRRFLNTAGPIDRLVSGWKITGIQQYSSGDPLGVISEVGTGIGSGPQFRPDVVAGVPQTVAFKGPIDSVNGTQYLNPASFADVPASPGNNFGMRFGTAPRFLPNIRGPARGGEDLGLYKETYINERFKFTLRADAFNAFNHTGRGDPNTDLDSGQFGLIFGPQQGPRAVQVSLRLDF